MPVAAQYREAGVLLFRGFGYDNVMNQCFGTYLDSSSQGKQMPIVRVSLPTSIATALTERT